MINEIFETLAETNSRNEKIEILKQHADNDTLKRVIYLACHPLTQFYIRKIPNYVSGDASMDLETAIEALDDLSSRRITGNAAIDHLQNILSSVSQSDAEVIKRIIRKDLKCGVSTATVNAIWPKFIVGYPCMLASGFDQKLADKMEFPALSQLKLDGMRFNAIVRNGACEFRSRSGREININDEEFAQLFVTMANGADLVFDGELLVTDTSGEILDRKTGNGILNKAVKGTQSTDEGKRVCTKLWDLIPYSAFTQGKDLTPYYQRLENLISLKSMSKRIMIVDSKQVESIEKAREHFEEVLATGQEGTILKSMNHPWESKRSAHQIKFKGELECDLKVVEWVEGQGKYQGRMGAVVAESSDGVVRVSIGSGFTDAQRDEYTPEIIVDKIISVKYNERITDVTNEKHSLFLPVFIELRLDKNEADSSKDIK
jgi:hypothetical protein